MMLVVGDMNLNHHPVFCGFDNGENVAALAILSKLPHMPLLPFFAIAHAEGITSNLARKEAAYIMDINTMQERKSIERGKRKRSYLPECARRKKMQDVCYRSYREP